MPSTDDPKDQCKDDAQQQRRRQRKIKNSILAAKKEVTGQAPNRQMEPPRNQQDNADKCNDAAHGQEHLSQIRHNPILSPGNFHRFALPSPIVSAMNPKLIAKDRLVSAAPADDD